MFSWFGNERLAALCFALILLLKLGELINNDVFCGYLRMFSCSLLGILMGAFIKIIEAQKLANWKVLL